MTSLVTLKNKTDQYDVYIGDSNEEWSLEKSIWSNPFKNSLSGDNLELYRSYIYKGELRKKLWRLDRKRLACFCEPPNCHGKVLLEILEKFHSEKFLTTDTSLLVFKGGDCPLSNFYSTPLIYERECFSSSIHLYSYLFMKDQLKASPCNLIDVLYANSYDAYEMLRDELERRKRQGIKSGFILSAAIKIMFIALNCKWEQCREFRHMCKENKKFLFVEGTRSNRWGAGKDISEFDSKDSPNELPGMNIMGWLVTLVYNKNKFPSNYSEMYKKCWKCTIECPMTSGHRLALRYHTARARAP